jgi:hypothetical protein
MTSTLLEQGRNVWTGLVNAVRRFRQRLDLILGRAQSAERMGLKDIRVEGARLISRPPSTAPAALSQPVTLARTAVARLRAGVDIIRRRVDKK